MARKKAVLNFNTFVAGLNTEASPLNFPENCSFDEKNFVLDKDGGRRRRLGMELQGNLLSLSTFYEVTSRLYPVKQGDGISVSTSFVGDELVNKVASLADSATIAPSYLGYVITGGSAETEDTASVVPSYMGYALTGVSTESEETATVTPSYIGHAITGIGTESSDSASVTPSYIGATIE